MAWKNALLCLNVAEAVSPVGLGKTFKAVSKYVNKRLYIHLYSGAHHVMPPVNIFLAQSSHMYVAASSHLPAVDVIVLQQYSGNKTLSCPVDLILVEKGEKFDSFASHICGYYGIPHSAERKEFEYQPDATDEEDKSSSFPAATFKNCALGGTFDRIHNGHKVLLSTAIALAEKSVVIGITDLSMNKKKTLCELIEPIEKRKSELYKFVSEVRQDLNYDIVTLRDPFGPTVTEPDLQCLVVSDETEKGAEAINRKRAELGYNKMEIVKIPVLENSARYEHQEQKISSSSIRESLLGEIIREPKEIMLSRRPYLIGLTGGIASGKSSVGKRLEGLGAGLVCSDQLAHRTYTKGCAAYGKIVKTFGEDVVDSQSGEIIRRRLGEKVFGDKEQMQKLNDIVWPATAQLVEEEIEKLSKQGKEVCFIEAALLLEAGWQDKLHEVWCCVIPEDEAVKRIQDRNNLSAEEAKIRIQSQQSNQYRVDRSNVVLSTLWDYPVTQKQVEKAWRLLLERI